MNKLLVLICFMLVTIEGIAQVQTATGQIGTAFEVQKTMSYKCDCCGSTYSAESIGAHAKTCCKNSGNITALKTMSYKCDCCGSTYSAEKIGDHAKTCCKTDTGTSISTSTARVKCPPGTYPNGSNCYPCLGCHPCPPSYCDNSTNAMAVPVDQLDPVLLIKDANEGGYLTKDLSPSTLKKIIKANSSQPMDSTTEKPKVKCSCGTNVYGKDEDACKRICEFLGGASGY